MITLHAERTMQGLLSCFYLVDQLPARVATPNVLFDHREQPFAGTRFFPQRPHKALLVGVIVAGAGKVLALVFDDKDASVLQLRDEIRVEKSGRQRQPE